MSKKKSTTKKKTTTKKSGGKRAKSSEQLTKEAIAAADANIARIDGEALAEGARANRRKEKAAKSAGAATAASKAKATRKAKAKPGADTGQPRQPKAKRVRKPSGLDLAAKVLSEAKEPLNAKTIAERAIAAGWKTNGATPHATLYAAMIREITAKGKEARFKKTARGMFEVNA